MKQLMGKSQVCFGLCFLLFLQDSTDVLQESRGWAIEAVFAFLCMPKTHLNPKKISSFPEQWKKSFGEMSTLRPCQLADWSFMLDAAGPVLGGLSLPDKVADPILPSVRSCLRLLYL